MDRPDFSDHFRKMIIRHKRIGYDLNVMRQSPCLVINPITVDNFAALLNCTPVDRAFPDLKPLILVGWDRSSFVCCLFHRSSFASDFQWLEDQGSPSVMQYVVFVESSSLLLHSIKT